MFRKNPIKLCNILCVILMAALLLCQFLPFWHVNDTAVSISSFIWFPSNHEDLETVFMETAGMDINDFVRPAVLLLILSLAGVILGLMKSENPVVSLLPLAAGCTGMWLYLGKPVFRQSSCWWLHLILSVALVVISAMCIYFGVQRFKTVEQKK